MFYCNELNNIWANQTKSNLQEKSGNISSHRKQGKIEFKFKIFLEKIV